MKCPQCKKPALGISGQANVDVAIDANGKISDYYMGEIEWDDNDSAWCHACGWEGTVREIDMGKEEEETGRDCIEA
jgi:hypothetical protein